MGQAHVPSSLALVHLQDDAGVGRWMVDGFLQKNKVRPELRHRDGMSADEQAHFHLRGMAAVR